MVDYETFCRIRDHLVRQQLTVAQTAKALGLDVRTVAKWAGREQFRARAAVPRSMQRHFDVEHPDHAQQLVMQRHSAREQRLLVQFLALSPRAQAYREGLEAKRVNTRMHLRKILALAEMHGREAVARAMDDGLDPQAFSAEYIAHILAARQRIGPEPGALQLTRARDLPFMRENYQPLAKTAADKQRSHIDYFTELLDGEAAAREDRRVQRCIAQARFPVLKTLDQFDWNWPTKINRPQIQNLFHLEFVAKRANVVFISGVGLGKSHLMTALGHAACQRGHSVLFTGAIDIINTLAAAHAAGGLKRALAVYVKPEVLAIDELGYLPIDKFGADCLFQIISHRYERGATLLTTNRIYKQWAGIFNNDATLTSALLDRLLHHAETVLIEGKSYRAHAEVEA